MITDTTRAAIEKLAKRENFADYFEFARYMQKTIREVTQEMWLFYKQCRSKRTAGTLLTSLFLIAADYILPE